MKALGIGQLMVMVAASLAKQYEPQPDAKPAKRAYARSTRSGTSGTKLARAASDGRLGVRCKA